MSRYAIRVFGDPVLKQKAAEVTNVDGALVQLTQDMIDTMYEAPGLGLAAPQVGVQKRLFVYDVGEGPQVLVNPQISDSRGEWEYEEGCLSVPGLYRDVSRPAGIEVEGLDLDGNPLSKSLDGFMARVWQHEIDHLDGVLFIDRLTPDERKEALATLRSQALGITPPPPAPPVEERL